VRVFEDKCRSNTHSLAVDFENFLSLVVLDPEVIANADHLLAHLVAVSATAWASQLAIVLSFLTSFLSSAWHENLSLSGATRSCIIDYWTLI
jgi:hypothetical protein